jgi:hypothetical protein
MSTLTLPQDVADEIIDAASLVDESYTILFNMSLVSKSFASGSQAHLFRTVKIWNATRCAELLDIIKHSPGLAPRIMNLEIHEMTDVNWLPVSYYQSGDHWIHSPESGELLDRLTNVEFIVLRNKRLDRTEVDRLVRCSLRGRLQSVIGLQLSNVHDLELDGLAHLLLHFPRLETLDTILTDISLVPSPHSETDSESVSPNRWIIRHLKLPGPPCLRRMTLSIHGQLDQGMPLPSWFVNSDRLKNIQDLYLRVHGSEALFKSSWALVRNAAPALRSLNLGMPRVHPAARGGGVLDPQYLETLLAPQLTQLELIDVQYKANLSWMTDILFAIDPSTPLREIRLVDMRIYSSVLGAFSMALWERLNAILARGYRDLENIKINIVFGVEGEDWPTPPTEEDIRRAMPDTDRRGILEFAIEICGDDDD